MLGRGISGYILLIQKDLQYSGSVGSDNILLKVPQGWGATVRTAQLQVIVSRLSKTVHAHLHQVEIRSQIASCVMDVQTTAQTLISASSNYVPLKIPSLKDPLHPWI